MIRVHHISAVTLKVIDMKRSCQFYSKIPGFRIVYGGNPYDAFSTFELSGRREGDSKTYLNLEVTEMTAGKRRIVSSLPNSSSNNSKRHQHHHDNSNNIAIGGNDDQHSNERDDDDNEESSLSEEKAFLQAGIESEEGKEGQGCRRGDFGRIIFHTENVDGLYRYMKKDEFLSKHTIFETEPADAPWGERFFHIREPDGYQLSFAQPLKK